ncbi:hypothetical protein B0H14DRAFT_1594217 [Mycena olivaceomarginata]|nr:hypothetical protein B0H14DRAFT_1594217 [Mycena olivaceomarginata]
MPWALQRCLHRAVPPEARADCVLRRGQDRACVGSHLLRSFVSLFPEPSWSRSNPIIQNDRRICNGGFVVSPAPTLAPRSPFPIHRMHAPNVSLVTGSSSGFGTCFIMSILACSDRVFATARTLGKMPPDSRRWTTCGSSTSRRGEVAIRDIVVEVVGFWRRIDVLVNNAGYRAKGELEEAGSAQMRRQYEVPWDPMSNDLNKLIYQNTRRTSSVRWT